MNNYEVYLCQPEELDGFISMSACSLNITEDTVRNWITVAGIGSVRVVRDCGRVIGGLFAVRDFQYFGTKAVPTAFVSCVCTDIRYQRRGVGRALIHRSLEEFYEEDVALATLHPTTIAFYRGVGFELAGSITWFRTTLDKLAWQPTPVVFSELMDVGDIGINHTLDELRRHWYAGARINPGHVRREHPFFWRSLLTCDSNARVLVLRFTRDEKAAGFVIILQRPEDKTMILRHIDLPTVDAARALSNFLITRKTMLDKVTWRGSVHDTFPSVQPESAAEIKCHWEWMTRIVDVKTALEARGFSPYISGKVDIKVVDELLEWNNHVFTLEVSGGIASVRETSVGADSCALDVRSLASLYTGHLTAYELERSGLLEGPHQGVAFLQGLFSRARPWMVDMF